MTDLSTPSQGGLPPMTLEQAVELANRMRTIQNGAAGFMSRNATLDSLLDHAAHGYKAAILLFDHCTQLETHLQEVSLGYMQIYRLLELVRADPVDGPILDALLAKYLTESGEVNPPE